MDQSAFISAAGDVAGLLHQERKLILAPRVMLAERSHSMLHLHYLIGIQGHEVPVCLNHQGQCCHQTDAKYLHHPPSLNKTHPTSFTKSWLEHCPRWFSIFLLAPFTFNILHSSTYTSQVICCSQYPSSQRATGVREKFLPQIKWSEIKMLPQHVPWLATLKEIGPLAALTEAPQSPKTTRTQFDWIQYCDNKAGLLNESCTQFSYVRELEECCNNLPSLFLPLLRLSVSIHCRYTFLSLTLFCLVLPYFFFFFFFAHTWSCLSVSFLLCIRLGEFKAFSAHLVWLVWSESFVSK